MRGLRGGTIASGLCLAAMMGGSAACAGQATEPNAKSQQVLEERIERLATSLESAQSQVDGLRKEMEVLRSDLKAAKVGSAGTVAGVPPAEERAEDELGPLRENQDVLAAEVKQHEQTKVESQSKFPLRVTGLVLFNAFVNEGVVDVVDLPTSALRRAANVSHGAAGGSMRQTWLGLEGQGPVFGAVHTSARVGMDFFGGVGGAINSGSTGSARLRTAAIRGETNSEMFEARFDEPLISPLSPSSLANVAQPSLAWTGNLWTWAPELRWQHTQPVGEARTLNIEVGLRDPYLAGLQTYNETRVPSPVELSRRPAFEARVSFGSAANAHTRIDGYSNDSVEGWRIGGGGSYARESYAGGISIDTWALTADWQVPLQRWLRLSGEAYKGTGLGGLGGGAYRDVVQGADRVTGVTRTIGLDAGGGWVQLQADATRRLQVNAAFGQDAGSGSELRLLILPTPYSALGYYARNRGITGNLIYRPWRSVVLSPEYRRIISWPISGSRNVANIFTLSAGYFF
jgi:outer membrane murein-binding lipoprotein Lpp